MVAPSGNQHILSPPPSTTEWVDSHPFGVNPRPRIIKTFIATKYLWELSTGSEMGHGIERRVYIIPLPWGWGIE
jgi:hypothetical protein